MADLAAMSVSINDRCGLTIYLSCKVSVKDDLSVVIEKLGDLEMSV